MSARKVPCACGCGQLTSWQYRRGHRPGASVNGTRALTRGQYREQDTRRLHRLRAEAALGHPLPPGAVVHYADGTRADDAPLVICPSHSYHALLHKRMRIKAAGGSPNTDSWCSDCQRPRPLAEFWVRKRGSHAGKLTTICRSCNLIRMRARAAHTAVPAAEA